MSKRQENTGNGAMKRLVFAVDVKGSAGKSFFQAHLLEALAQWGGSVHGYDPDTSFHRMEAMCGPERVTRLNFEDSESRSIPVIDLVEGRCDVAVIDGVGSQLARQKAYFKAVDFFANITDLNLVTTFVALIEDDTVIFEQVARLIGDVGKRADWVFVKNPKLFNEQFSADGDQEFRFPVWDRSEIRRKALSELPSAEIMLPKLSQKEAAYLVENNATTLKASKDTRLFMNSIDAFSPLGVVEITPDGVEDESRFEPTLAPEQNMGERADEEILSPTEGEIRRQLEREELAEAAQESLAKDQPQRRDKTRPGTFAPNLQINRAALSPGEKLPPIPTHEDLTGLLAHEVTTRCAGSNQPARFWVNSLAACKNI